MQFVQSVFIIQVHSLPFSDDVLKSVSCEAEYQLGRKAHHAIYRLRPYHKSDLPPVKTLPGVTTSVTWYQITHLLDICSSSSSIEFVLRLARLELPVAWAVWLQVCLVAHPSMFASLLELTLRLR